MPIQDKINSLEKEIGSKQNDIMRLRKAEIILNNIDAHFDDVIAALKLIVPEHDRTSCSDTKPDNMGRCTRCDILGMESAGVWNDEYVLEVSINKVE